MPSCASPRCGVGELSLLDAWMPAYDVAARYETRIAAPPERVWATLLETDFAGPWLVRALMGIRLLPALMRGHPPRPRRRSLRDLAESDFVLLEEAPPREIVLGITGRFWTLRAQIVRVPPAQFREPIPAGLARAAWNFAVAAAPGGSVLSTETRIRCADPDTLRRFRRYWWVVSPGSGLIRRTILGQVRREACGRMRG